ncbi:hypothetical protein DFJ73DRAFT_238920 [Zopfochytrium polystomum]|nr:hypothetical protein DFJ73DRAFT_238920 [Zopfochytrium polystomum]
MGREAGQGVDMLVPGPSYIRQRSSWSAESSGPRHSPFLMTSHQPRFPFRLLCSRSAPYTTRIFAGAFDAQGRLVLGKKSIRFTAGHKTRRDWRMSTPSTNISSISVDALPESSVLVWRRDWIDPGASRWSRSELKGRWVEVSAVRGNAYSLRPDPKSKGQKIEELDDGEDGLNLGDEAIIYAGGVCFWWKSSQGKGEIDEVGVSSQASEKKSMAAKTWGLESFSEMMQDFERKVICPVTLDNILVDHMAESISGRSLKPWSRLFTRLRWTQEAAGNESTEADNALNLQEALSACSDVGEGQNLVTKRPWVFIACGHVVSFIEPKFLRPVVEERRRSLIGGGQDVENAAQEAEATAEANQAAYAFDPQSAAAAISALRTHCVVCRTVSRFVPLVARAQPDLLCGPAAFVFDPCGHVIHEEGATMWGREVAVPRLATVARDANGVIRTTAKAHGIGTPVIGTDLEAPAVTDTAAVCGPVRVEEYPGFSLFGSAPRAGGTGGWCHFCPFCATETVGVRRLYCVTE